MTRNGWTGIGLTLFAASLAYGLFLRHGVAPAVVGYNLVPSERVLLGEVPYRDFIYNYTPGVLWLNAILFKLLGTTLMAARLGVFASKLAAILLLYLLGKQYLPGWLALLPVLMTLCWVGYGDILKAFPTQYGMFFLLAAWFFLNKSDLRNHPNEGAGPRQNRLAMLVAAGALAGGVLIFKQNVGLFACAAVVLLAAAGPARLPSDRPAGNGASPQPSKPPKLPKLSRLSGLSRLSRLFAVLAGMALVAIPAAIYLASKSALLPMLDHFRRHAVAYEEAKGIALPAPPALLVSTIAAFAVVVVALIILRSAPRLIPHLSVAVASLLLVVIAIGDRSPSGALYRSVAAQVYYLPIYAALAGGTWVAAEYIRGNRTRAAGLLALVLIPAAAFIEVFPRSDPDHLVRVLPPSLLLICVLIHELGRRLAPAKPRPPDELEASDEPTPHPFPSLLVVAAAVVISTIGLRVTWSPQFDGAFRMVENSPLEFEKARGICGSELEAGRFNRLVEYVDEHSDPADPIFTTARKVTAVYFFAARPNTTRMLWFDSAGIPGEAREQVYQAIAERKYKLVLTGGAADADSDRTTNIEAYERHVASLLNEHYHKTATISGINIFEPNQADNDTLRH